MSTPAFSICHATARPLGWSDSFASCAENAVYVRPIEYILSIDERFGEFGLDSAIFPRIVKLDPSEPRNSVANWNNAARHATGSVLILNADDFRFPANWDEELLRVIPDLNGDFVIHVSTGCPDPAWESRVITFGILSRKTYERWGYALYPEYESMESDVDFTERAYREGIVIEARHLLFEHLHPIFRKAKEDDVYRHQNRKEAYALGAQILARRRVEGFAR